MNMQTSLTDNKIFTIWWLNLVIYLKSMYIDFLLQRIFFFYVHNILMITQREQNNDALLYDNWIIFYLNFKQTIIKIGESFFL